MEEDMAIKVAVKKNRHLIEIILETLTSEDQSENESEDDGIGYVSEEDD